MGRSNRIFRGRPGNVGGGTSWEPIFASWELFNGIKTQFSSVKFNKFLAKTLSPFLFRQSFWYPDVLLLCCHLIISYYFFCLQKFFKRELVWTNTYSVFLLSFRKTMFAKLRTVLGKILSALLTIFFMFDSRIISFVRPFLPTWITVGFRSVHDQFFL